MKDPNKQETKSIHQPAMIVSKHVNQMIGQRDDKSKEVFIWPLFSKLKRGGFWERPPSDESPIETQHM